MLRCTCGSVPGSIPGGRRSAMLSTSVRYTILSIGQLEMSPGLICGAVMSGSFEWTAWDQCMSPDGQREGLLVGEPRTARLLEVVPLGEHRVIGLAEFLGRGADAIGDGRQLLEVEVVERCRV